MNTRKACRTGAVVTTTSDNLTVIEMTGHTVSSIRGSYATRNTDAPRYATCRPQTTGKMLHSEADLKILTVKHHTDQISGKWIMLGFGNVKGSTKDGNLLKGKSQEDRHT
ncbi:hypothetical protein M8J75_000468 [Diaphorina citri]|nr:hypothetical protein M8J75_000468 [Diaphorina citri]